MTRPLRKSALVVRRVWRRIVIAGGAAASCVPSLTCLGPALGLLGSSVLRTKLATTILTLLALASGCGRSGEPITTGAQAHAQDALPTQDVLALADANLRLEKALSAMVPKDPYIVVDTHESKIYYKQGDKIIHEALCSAGCDSVLRAPDGRVWNFATPKGLFRVKGKIRNPTWVKPDWAFIEEGLPVPKRDHPDRFDKSAMGSYALDFGDGYYIHGTLYRRLLGENITHGCVRVADEDLEPIFTKAKVGTPIYIF